MYMIYVYTYICIHYYYNYIYAYDIDAFFTTYCWPSIDLIAVVFPKHLNLHPVKITASQGWSVDVIGCRQSCGTTTTGDWGKTRCGVKWCRFQPFGYLHVTPRKFNIASKKFDNPKRKLVFQSSIFRGYVKFSAVYLLLFAKKGMIYNWLRTNYLESKWAMFGLDTKTDLKGLKILKK